MPTLLAPTEAGGPYRLPWSSMISLFTNFLPPPLHHILVIYLPLVSWSGYKICHTTATTAAVHTQNNAGILYFEDVFFGPASCALMIIMRPSNSNNWGSRSLFYFLTFQTIYTSYTSMKLASFWTLKLT